MPVMELVVPYGALPGQLLQVQLEDGRTVQMQVGQRETTDHTAVQVFILGEITYILTRVVNVQT